MLQRRSFTTGERLSPDQTCRNDPGARKKFAGKNANRRAERASERADRGANYLLDEGEKGTRAVFRRRLHGFLDRAHKAPS